jgi:hypothetical protein
MCLLKYCNVLGVCVTHKTGFGFNERIYWTFIQLVTTFQTSLHSTGHSRLLITLHKTTRPGDRVTLCYIASGRAAQKTRPLLSSGRLLFSRIVVHITYQRAVYQEPVTAEMCLLSRCLAMDLIMYSEVNRIFHISIRIIRHPDKL